MYAVIKTGGKQYKVNKGDILEVEHIRLKGEETTTDLTPILVVTDEGKAIHGAKELASYKVGVKMLGDAKGDKVTVFKYRPKSGYASKTGHRQLYSLIEITSIGDQSKDDKKPAKAQKPAAGAKKSSEPAAEPAAEAKKSAEPAEVKKSAEPAETAPDSETATLDANGS